MVGHTGRTSDTRRIRRLRTPRPIEVEASVNGAPLRARLGSALSTGSGQGWQDVSLARAVWRLDQHWWRSEPVRRDYYRVAIEDGPRVTLYHDLVNGGWFRQEY